MGEIPTLLREQINYFELFWNFSKVSFFQVQRFPAHLMQLLEINNEKVWVQLIFFYNKLKVYEGKNLYTRTFAWKIVILFIDVTRDLFFFFVGQ